jgi:hypothetical protein
MDQQNDLGSVRIDVGDDVMDDGADAPQSLAGPDFTLAATSEVPGQEGTLTTTCSASAPVQTAADLLAAAKSG